ncbi:cyclophilin-like fold protein [Pedobacter sp. BMA]|uniref:cyclophilin-like fold protein n=1 Tax=Pedobacter sp. BMA TaxID=1663685 RepID=UPI000649D357|nr:cyclophilin-like fold protein [Pedobacter sp. BMA]KLT65511.1 hypothetical protein AB669_10570 [Pedobacter sp. BMA]
MKAIRTVRYFMMKRLNLIAILILVLLIGIPAILIQGENDEGPIASRQQNISGKKLKISSGGRSVEAVLTENATTRAFITRLPMTLKMKDIDHREKYALLSIKLPVKSPVEKQHVIGDVSYLPDGRISIIYHQDNKPTNLKFIKLASIGATVNALSLESLSEISFELIKNHD